jgi:hypothetical protein
MTPGTLLYHHLLQTTVDVLLWAGLTTALVYYAIAR